MISSFGRAKWSVSVKGEDMTQAVTGVTVFQDLFSPSWSIEVEVLETAGFLSRAGFTAGDDIVFTCEVKQGFDTDGTVSLSFVVCEIGERQQTASQTTAYTIRGIAPWVLQDRYTKSCEVLKSQKIEDMVSTLAQKIGAKVGDKAGKSATPEAPLSTSGSRKPSKTESEMSYIVANKSPLTAIARLSKAAMMDGTADFTFFQKDKDLCAFESLKNCFARMPVTKFVQRPSRTREKPDAHVNENLRFQSFGFEHFNALTNAASGRDGASVAVFDLVDKKFSVSTSGKHPQGVIHFAPSHIQMWQGQAALHDRVASWFPSRRTSLFAAEQNRLTLQCYGQPSAFGWLSETVEVDVPSPNSLEPSEALDKRYKGKYLVIAMAHLFTKGTYFINYELANGFDK